MLHARGGGSPGSARLVSLGALVFCSGCSALIYQTGWLRELRLVFGASTPASAAVLAIFMGGLGLGGAKIGRLVDRHPNPLKLYALLEAGITASAMASPLLFVAVRKLYLATGGSAALGTPLAFAVRLALAALVLAVPTILMGGTLPAIAGAARSSADASRRRVALLYGVNTLGAVCGVCGATFLLLERLGTRWTVLAAVALNAATAAAAWLLASRSRPPEPIAAAVSAASGEDAGGNPTWRTRGFLTAAAALTGFVFFFMELVWYRMLAPLLGGSTYTLGLIFAVALAGIGIGGLLYTIVGRRLSPTPALLAATCGLEALGMAAAFGLGDRIALLAIALRPDTAAWLGPLVAGWTLICAIVVFPAALVAGYQFPLLIGLAGSGAGQVGRHTGSLLAANAAGSILGSAVGGILLLPALGAPGCWRLAVALLAALGLAAAVVSLRQGARTVSLAAAAAPLVLALLLTAGEGPTAAWRHSPIGSSRITLADAPNTRRAWLNTQRGAIVWERDGVESSVALHRWDGLAFVVNGKIDGNARGDAGTQVMAPLIAALLHPHPRRAAVIGLGTGSSAGWLAAVDSIERVDVAEMEPAVLEVARRCGPVNREALANPKVRVFRGDGREFLMTARERYDIVFSEPSNPYRAGVSALYTLEFYRAVLDRLEPGGIFGQWIQAYDVDPATVRVVAATLASVFGDVETYQTTPGDLLFLCSAGPKSYDAERLATRLATEPFRSGLLAGWGVTGLTGFLSGYLANDEFARHARRRVGESGGLNTDDLSPVEFSFARDVGRRGFSLDNFRQVSRERSAHRPALAGGTVDWDRVDAERRLVEIWQSHKSEEPVVSLHDAACRAYAFARRDEVVDAWAAGWRPEAPLESVMIAESLAEFGDGRAETFLPRVAEHWPASAAAIEARLHARRGDGQRSLEALARAVRGFRTSPWEPWPVMHGTLLVAAELATVHPALAPAVFELLDAPFSVLTLEQTRSAVLLGLGAQLGPGFCERAFSLAEPHVHWDEQTLRARAECYATTGNPRAGRARRDLEAFLAAAPESPGQR